MLNQLRTIREQADDEFYDSFSKDAESASFRAHASFEEFKDSKLGKKYLRQERDRLTTQMRELAKERKKLDLQDRIVEHVKEVWEYFDRELTGEITRDECKTLVQKLRVPLLDAELEDSMDMVDIDQSGCISLKEFVSWYKHEYRVLSKRDSKCGTMGTFEKKWYIESMSTKSIKARYETWIALHGTRRREIPALSLGYRLGRAQGQRVNDEMSSSTSSSSDGGDSDNQSSMSSLSTGSDNDAHNDR